MKRLQKITLDICLKRTECFLTWAFYEELRIPLDSVHRADTKVNTDYFSLFIFHKILNMWKSKKYFKISNCGFGLELNAF